MTKSKKALQEEQSLQGAAPAQTQEAAAPAPAAEPAAEEEAQEEEAAADPDPLHLIVLAHPGTEELLRRVWEIFYDLPLRVIPFQEGDTLATVLESIMAMEDVDRMFAVVPANCIPCSEVRWGELQLPRVYVDTTGNRSFWGRVPVCFDKEVLVDFLPAHSEDGDEALVNAYVSAFGCGRPEMVGQSFGNYIVNVMRGAPCESAVIECLLQKRFLYANAVGWNAIADLIAKAFLG